MDGSRGVGRAHLSKALWMVWRWMGEVTEWEKLLLVMRSILHGGV
jgi:hypothetical protein